MSSWYFYEHITESISINSERRPFYKEISSGKSETGFRLLIALEILMVPTALYWDLCCSYYQKRGIPLMQDEFVSMNRTPEFDANKRTVPDDFVSIPWKDFQSRLKNAIKTGEAEKVLNVSAEIILEMKSYPHYYPMTRHLVESIYRFAWFCPMRIKAAQDMGLKSPQRLIFQIMSYHLFGFWFFVQIDKSCAPVQSQGIPMLTSELPDLMADLK